MSDVSNGRGDPSVWAVGEYNGKNAAAHARVEPAIRVLVIDPSEFGRACTAAGLESATCLTLSCCAGVAGCDIAVAPQLVLFQTAPPVSAGSTLIEEIKLAARRWPSARLLVVADQAEDSGMLAMIRAGTHGLLPSSATLVCIHSAILLLANDIGVYPPALTTYLQQTAKMRSGPAQPAQPAQPAAPGPSSGHLETLTKRQNEVLRLLAAGSSNKAIALHLQISESTVKVHIRNIMSLHGAVNRTQLVAIFLQSTKRKE